MLYYYELFTFIFTFIFITMYSSFVMSTTFCNHSHSPIRPVHHGKLVHLDALPSIHGHTMHVLRQMLWHLHQLVAENPHQHQWGFLARHGEPQNRWFISWKMPEMDDDWGYPHDYGNLVDCPASHL